MPFGKRDEAEYGDSRRREKYEEPGFGQPWFYPAANEQGSNEPRPRPDGYAGLGGIQGGADMTGGGDALLLALTYL
jgi:hypothetical protein